MQIVADLHIHTSASDGIKTPEEVVIMAADMGLAAISITDHDSVDGLAEAMAAARGKSLDVIPGIELSSVQGEQEVHILGYGLDFENHELLDMLKVLNNSRVRRAEKMVRRLNELGYSLDMSDVLAFSAGSAPGRPHIARALIEKGYVSTMSAAFAELLGPGRAAYVERFKLMAAEAVSIIQRAGGVAVWAHPSLAGGSRALQKALTAAGLDGYEAFHPDMTDRQTDYYLKLAREKNMCISGGSDFHGDKGGTEKHLASCGLSDSLLDSFRTYLKKKAVFS